MGYLTGIDPTDPQPAPSGRLVLVFTAASIPEGLLVKGLFESEHVPVLAKGESEGPYRSGPMELWVPEEFEMQARALVEEIRTHGLEVGDEPAEEQP